MVVKRCVHRVLSRAQQAEYDGDLAGALRLAEAVLEEYPAHAEARLVRARVWARTGRMEIALQELRALVEKDANHMEARLALTGALLLGGRYGDAVDHLIVVARQCGEDLEKGLEEGEDISFSRLPGMPGLPGMPLAMRGPGPKGTADWRMRRRN